MLHIKEVLALAYYCYYY